MHKEALQVLQELQQAALPSPYNVAIVHLGLGHHEQAIDWLEKAFAVRNNHMVYTNVGAKVRSPAR